MTELKTFETHLESVCRRVATTVLNDVKGIKCTKGQPYVLHSYPVSKHYGSVSAWDYDGELVGFRLAKTAPTSLCIRWGVGVVDPDTVSSIVLKPGAFAYAINDKYILPRSALTEEVWCTVQRTDDSLGGPVGLTRVMVNFPDDITRGLKSRGAFCRDGRGCVYFKYWVVKNRHVDGAIELLDMRTLEREEEAAPASPEKAKATRSTGGHYVRLGEVIKVLAPQFGTCVEAFLRGHFGDPDVSPSKTVFTTKDSTEPSDKFDRMLEEVVSIRKLLEMNHKFR